MRTRKKMLMHTPSSFLSGAAGDEHSPTPSALRHSRRPTPKNLVKVFEVEAVTKRQAGCAVLP